MTNLIRKTLLTTASLVLVTAAAGDANAQTASVVATAEVSNELTLATAVEMNFGDVALVGNAATGTATATISAGGALSVGTTGTGAASAIVDNAAATAAQITIEDGADGATVNVTINNLTNPTNGTDTLDFAVAAFSTSLNGTAAVTRTSPTPFTMVYDGSFGGGTNTLDIGATVATQAALTGAADDGTYIGGFDVVFAY